MIERKNIIFEMAAKKGIEMCRENHFNSARQMLEKTGLPLLVIERLLYEPQKPEAMIMKSIRAQ